MPIGEDEWERGRTRHTLESQIEKFLEQERPKAFTPWEVVNALGLQPPEREIDDFMDGMQAFSEAAVAYLPVERALENLVESGRIEKKHIEQKTGTMPYYKAT